MKSDQDEPGLSRKKQIALDYLSEAWDEALAEGVDPDIVAHAALFTAISDLVESYGEEAVAELAGKLADRILRSEFTVGRTVN